MSKHTIGEVDDFPEGRGKKVNVEGIEIAVFNLEGDLHGIQNTCPHRRYPLDRAGAPKLVSKQRGDEPGILGDIDRENCMIKCPWHQMEWDLETGENPIEGHISTFDIEVDNDGTVTVEI